MEEKKENKVSSGAKKVETIEREKAKKPRASAPKKQKSEAEKKASRAEKAEEQAAEKRLSAAKQKAEKKEQKLISRAKRKEKQIEKRANRKENRAQKQRALKEKRAERRQKRVEDAEKLKEKRLEKRAARSARREMLKNESKADRNARRAREKKERKAIANQKRERREQARAERMKSREARREARSASRKKKREQNKSRTPGFGGWLAAVISLGAACLALGTIVTAGALRMNDMTLESANGYRTTLFELSSVSMNMENSLTKLRVSSGAREQRTLLTELLVDSELMESAIERTPVDNMTSTDISAFVNKTGNYARQLLKKLDEGKSLSENEKKTVDYLYQVNEGLYQELNHLMTHMSEKDFTAFIGGKGGAVSEKFVKMGQSTLQQPEEIVDAPFSDEGNVEENRLQQEEEISETRAEELLRGYLQDYHIQDCRYTGETFLNEAELYNYILTDEKGGEIFAQVTKRGGKLAFFNTYEICEEKNFDLETCDSLAKEFLSSLGIEDAEAVWLSDSGMVADITYVAVQDGVRLYPDLIKIRVCESKGRVVGMEAFEYLLNHKERKIGPSSSREIAQGKLSENLEPYAAHLAIIPIDGEEILTHEFACTYGEEEFIVYLDASTLDEIEVYRVRNSARGSYLE